ncbi:MAG TPA: type VI secretion system baseplate subunit TssF, partial [Anaeromyxobacteraceae bacterium]|nr:type VI secretion system baseplate subunit TssF [Anaeromyxobacteraceae bacterium]
MFSKHYQDELTFLRATGKAYAEANPSTAGLLAERGGDPDVERLLEGFAFLAARVRERLEAGVPEVIHDLTELLLPQYLRPIPAATVVEMVPIPGALRNRARVPVGTELASAPVDGTPCRFRTTADLDLLPVAVQEVLLDQSVSALPVLRVQLQVAPQAAAALFQPEGLRLFLHGEFPSASALLLALARHLRGLKVRALPSGRPVPLPPSALRLVGLTPELPLLPWPALAPEGYRTLLEYFTLPQKLLFFEIRDLQLAREAAAERIELALELERPPELPARLGKDSLRTNCVPAVNLFRASADPVSVEALGEEHLLRAAEIPPLHMEIQAVESVLCAPQGPGERRPLESFTSFRHGPAGRGARYYRLRRELS